MKGKAKELFEEWYDKQGDFYHLDIMPLSHKWGVYQDFFDSQGMNVHLYKFTYVFTFMIDGFEYKNYNQVMECKEAFQKEYKTRQEARQAALEKANEILNEKL